MAAAQFCEWVQVRIDVYIPRRKYQVKRHLHPWFYAACAALIALRNHLFRIYQHNKSSASKVKFRQASTKGFLKLPKLLMLIKQDSHLLVVLLTKVNLLYSLYSTALRCCLLHLIRKIACRKLF